MKQLLFLLILFSATAFTTKIFSTKETAIVNREGGIYIFTDCKPSAEYEVIDVCTSAKVNMDLKTFESTGLDYEQLKEEILRQLKQKKNAERFKGAEAVIIYPNLQKADVIKFKE